ncbi:transposase [Streptomyces sp. NPDC051976]|uniref:transposase n=1 Tax=Streptomyces sp. NPDC051976 TaxID=3154947 RepID=UPI00341C6AE3
MRAKAGLNRAVLDKGWHLLDLALRNAARTTGTTITLVPAAHTSQTCNACGHVDPNNRESQAAFECTACGHQDHADVNAAKNILIAAGHAVSGRGDLGVTRSTKRQPPATRTRTGRNPRAARAAGIPVLQHGEEVKSTDIERGRGDGAAAGSLGRSCTRGPVIR